VNQAAATAPAGTATITGIKKGRCFFVGVVNLNTVVVKKGVTSLVEGTDYTLGLNTGIITILTGGVTLSDGDDISLTFGNAALLRH